MTDLAILAAVVVSATGGVSGWAFTKAVIAGVRLPARDPQILEPAFDEAFGDVARAPIPADMAELLDRLN